MIIRKLDIEKDATAISKIWEEYYSKEFSLPDLTNSLTFAVVENEGKIVAFGIVKAFVEAIMIVDKSESTRDKSEAMKLLLSKAETDTKAAGITQLHTFCNDPKFAELLIKHFDFRPIENEGLIKDL